MGGEHTFRGAVRTLGLAIFLAATPAIVTAQGHDPDCSGESLVRALPPTTVTPPKKTCTKVCHHVCGWSCKKSSKKTRSKKKWQSKKAKWSKKHSKKNRTKKKCKHVCKKTCKTICLKICKKPKDTKLTFGVPTTQGRWFLTITRDHYARPKVRLNGKTVLRSSDFRKASLRLEITPQLQNELSFSSFKKGELAVQVDGIVADAQLPSNYPPEQIQHVVQQTLFSQTFERPQRGGFFWFLCRWKEECVQVTVPATEGLFTLSATASRLGSARVRWNGDTVFNVWDFWWRSKSAAVPVSVAPTNELCVRVHGWRGSTVKVELSGYVVDSQAPELNFQSPEPGACLGPSGQVVLSFSDALSGVAPGSLQVVLNGVDVTGSFTQSADGATASLADLPVSEGTNSLVARVRDAACNVANATVSFVVDTTPPTLALEPADGAALTEPQVTLKATFDDGSGCGIDATSLTATLDGQPIQLTAGTGSAQTTLELADGSHTFSVTISDLRGNAVTKSTTFTVESGPKIVVPSSLSFPEVRVTTSVTRTLTISNDSDKAALVVSAAQTTGDFALDPPFQQLTIPANGSAAVTIRFQPTDVGQRTGILKLTSNDTSTPVATVALSGTGGVGRVEMTLSGPDSGLPAGTLHKLKLTAVDSAGGTDTTFTGLVELKTTDPFSPLNDLLVSFTASDQGVYELPELPAFFTSGEQTITAHLLRLDGSTPSIGTKQITVLPAPKGQVYVVVPTGTYQPGNLITAQVLIDVGPDDRDPLTFNDTLGSYEFRLVFDRRVFQVASVVGGSSSLGEPMFVAPGENYVRFQDVNDLGTLQNPLGPDPNATGILEVAKIQLLVRQTAPRGATPIFLAVDSLTTAENPDPVATGLGDATPRLAEQRGQITINSASAEASFQLLATLPFAEDNLVSPQQLFRPGVVALFSHDLDPTSLAGQVQLLDEQGVAVPGTVSTGSPIAVFAPTSPVASGAYTLEVLAGVADTGGRTLATPRSVSFGVGPVSEPESADFDADGEVTASDVRRIINATLSGNPPSVPPIFTRGLPGSLAAGEGTSTTLSVTLSDAASGFAAVEVVNGPSYVTASLTQSVGGETSYQFTFAPGAKDATEEKTSVTVRTTNAQGQTATAKVELKVENKSVPPVLLPRIPSSPVLSVKETGQPLEFTVWVYDIDRDDEHFKNTIDIVKVASVTPVNGSSPDVPLTASNFTLQYIPPPEEENPGPFTPTGKVAIVRGDRTTHDNAGLYMIELSAKDTAGETSTLHYFLEVIDSNRRPTTQVDSQEGLFPLVGKQEIVTFTAEDPDGDPLRIALTAAAQQRVDRLVADGVASISVVEGPFQPASQPGRPSRRTLTVTFTYSGVVDSDGAAANALLETVAGDGRTISALNTSARREIGPKGLALRLLAKDGYVHPDRVFGRHTIVNFMGQFQTWFNVELSVTNATYNYLAVSAPSHPDVGVPAGVPTRGTPLTTVSISAFYTSLAHNPDLTPFPLKIDVFTDQGPFSTEVLVVPLPFKPDDPPPAGPIPVVVSPAQGAAVGSYFDVRVLVPLTGPTVERVDLNSLAGANRLGVASRSVGAGGVDMSFRFHATHDSISMTFLAVGGEFGAAISQPLNLVREATSSATPSLVLVRKINGSYEKVDPFIIKQGQTFSAIPLSDDNPFVYRALVDSALAEPATVAFTVKPGQANPGTLTLAPSSLPYRKTSSETIAAGKAYVSPPLVFGYRQIDPPAVSLNPFRSLPGGLGISLPGDPNKTEFPLPTASSHQIGEVLADAQLSAPGFAQVSAGSTTPRVPGLLFRDSEGSGVLEGAQVGDRQPRIEVYFPFGGTVTGAPPASGYQLTVDQGPDSNSAPLILSVTRRETLRFVYDVAEMPGTIFLKPGLNRARFFNNGILEFEATFSVGCQQADGRLLPLRTTETKDVPKGCDGAFPGQQKDSDVPTGEIPFDDGDAPATLKETEAGTGADILLATGELRMTRTDLVVPGRAGMDFVMRRTYRSKIHFNGPLGHGWDFNYNEGLYLVPADSPDGSFKKDDVQRLNGYGRVDTWKFLGDGKYKAPTGHYGTLTRLQDESFVLRSPNGFKRFYDKDGRLQKYQDRHKNTMHFKYDENGLLDYVIDAYGRKIDFEFQAKPRGDHLEGEVYRLAKITDFTGREITYTYNDARGELKSVTTPKVTGTSTGNDFLNGRTEEYTYCGGEEPPPVPKLDRRLVHNLMTVTRPHEFATGNKTTHAHTIIFGEEKIKPHTFDRVVRETIGGTNDSQIPAGCNKFYEYTPHQNTAVPAGSLRTPRLKIKVTDRNDNVRELYANELSHHIETRELTKKGEGKTPLRPGEPDHYKTESFFNGDGLLVRRKFPLGNDVLYAYHTTEPRASQANLLAITRRADSSRGGGENLVTRFAYDPIFNRLVGVTDPRGSATSFIPPLGRPSPTRYTTVFYLDYQEGTASQILALASSEKVTLTATEASKWSKNTDLNGDGARNQQAGNVVKSVAPTVQLLTGSQEATRRGKTSQEIVTETWWNERGQVRKTIDPEGNVTKFEYYPENEPGGIGTASGSPDAPTPPTASPWGYLKLVTRDAEKAPQTPRRLLQPQEPTQLKTEYGYDKVGNLTRIKNPRGIVTHVEVNQLNEVVQVTRGALTAGAFPDQLPTNEAPLAYKFQKIYDANGRVIETRTENKGFVQDGTDATDNPSADIGEGSFVIRRFQYDILDNLIQVTAQVSKNVFLTTSYRYDDNENLQFVIEPEGNRTRTLYDERDLPFKITRGSGSTISPTSDPSSASTTQVDYDRNGNREFVHDAQDNDGDSKPEKTKFVYDGFDRVVKVIDPLGNRSTVTYDVAGNAVKRQFHGHKPIALPTASSPKVLLSEVHYRHDELNRLYQTDEKLIDVASTGFTVLRTPDLRDQNRDGFVTSRIEYDALSRPTFAVEDDGEVTSTVYDGASRAVETKDALGNRTLTTYDNNSNPRIVVSSEVATQNVVQAELFKTLYVYDQLDRLIRVTDNAGQTTRFRYDSRNNLVQTADAEGPLGPDPLNLCPLPINLPGTDKENFPGGNTKNYFFDGLGRRVRVTCDLRVGGTGAGAIDTTNSKNSDGKVTLRYVWDRNSRIKEIKDDNGNKTQFTYDGLSRKVSQLNADGQSWKYDYDKDHNVVQVTDPNGTVINKSHDALNRLTRIDLTAVSPGVVGSTQDKFQYDGLSRLTRSEDNNGGAPQVCERVYDSLSRLIEERFNGKAVSSVFTGDSKRVKCTYPGGRVITTTFDKIDRVDTVKEGSNLIVRCEWIGPGMRELRRLNGNNTGLTFMDALTKQADGYDGVKRIKKLRVFGASSFLVDREYQYNRTNMRVSEKRNDDSQFTDTYTYDSLYRVIKTQLDQAGQPGATPRAIAQIEYLLDGVGNRHEVKKTSRAGVPAPPELFTVNNMNEYLSVAGASRTYSDNGNLKSDGKKTYSYDYKNRLVQVTDTQTGTPLGRYLYFADNRRASKEALTELGFAQKTEYFYDGWRVVEEQISGVTIASFVYSPVYIDAPVQMKREAAHPASRATDPTTGQQRGAGEIYLHQDGRANVVAATDQTGALREHTRYDDFGNPEYIGGTFGGPPGDGGGGDGRVRSAVGNPYGFQGRRRDPATGLVYFRNRYYEPETGRFIQRDPVWDPANAGNQYSFAANAPATARDPSGLFAETPWDTFSLGLGLISLAHNLGRGKLKEAAIDAFGVAVDALAVAAPGLPGGAGAAIKAYRAGNIASKGYGAGHKIDKAIDTLQAADQTLNVTQAADAAKESFKKGESGWGAFQATLAAVGGVGAVGKARLAWNGVCFLEGTLVETANGRKRIEEVKVGDRVLSRDDQTGKQGYKRVVRLFPGKTETVCRVTVGAARQRGRSQRHDVGKPGGSVKADADEPPLVPSQTLRCTPGHEFYRLNTKSWVDAEQLKHGDRLLGSKGEELSVFRVVVRQEKAATYNFEVENWHTYFVADKVSAPGVWVHNKDCDRVVGFEARHGQSVYAAAMDLRRPNLPARRSEVAPVEIRFPVLGRKDPAFKNAFKRHLAEQEWELNRLSLTDPRQLNFNLLNFPNIKKLNKAARDHMRRRRPPGVTGDAAHALDAVAGGFIFNFVGFRPSRAQQYIGSLWKKRAAQIVPGRRHRLIPEFRD